MNEIIKQAAKILATNIRSRPVTIDDAFDVLEAFFDDFGLVSIEMAEQVAAEVNENRR